jgi:hypothetical protein
LWGDWRHRWCAGNACRLYYNEPRSAPGFLALSYLISSRTASVATVLRALGVLDEIARLKRSDAVVCDVSNLRISDRLLKRWGWSPLRASALHRPFIKRFYGTYPLPHHALAGLLHSAQAAESTGEPRSAFSAQ